jgi:hypothetical protein
MLLLELLKTTQSEYHYNICHSGLLTVLHPFLLNDADEEKKEIAIIILMIKEIQLTSIKTIPK